MKENTPECNTPQEETVKKKKKRFGVRSLSSYMRELSIVIAGIAITFIIGSWIGDHREKKELETYLDAVRNELEENLAILHDNLVVYRQTTRMALYLHSAPLDRLNRDTIETINDIPHGDLVSYVGTFDIKKSAFEMFQSSGMMRLIKDKNVSTSIIDAYTKLERTRNECADYMARKTDIIYQTLMSVPGRRGGIDIYDPSYKDIYNFMSVHVSNDVRIDEGITQIESTLSLF